MGLDPNPAENGEEQGHGRGLGKGVCLALLALSPASRVCITFLWIMFLGERPLKPPTMCLRVYVPHHKRALPVSEAPKSATPSIAAGPHLLGTVPSGGCRQPPAKMSRNTHSQNACLAKEVLLTSLSGVGENLGTAPDTFQVKGVWMVPGAVTGKAAGKAPQALTEARHDPLLGAGGVGAQEVGQGLPKCRVATPGRGRGYAPAS